MPARDPRTGAPLHLGARRVLATGALDEAWQPDSAFVFRAAVLGAARRSPDGNGGTFIAWVEERGDWSAIRLSRVAAGGLAHEGWPARGIVVCEGPGSRYAPEVAGDGSGGAYVAWTDYGSGEVLVRVQHVSDEGALAATWPVVGAAIATSSGEQFNSHLIADEGGATIVWEDRRTGAIRLFAQRLEPSGERAANWPAEGLPIDTLGTSSLAARLHPLASGGAVLTWERLEPEALPRLMATIVPEGSNWSGAMIPPIALTDPTEALGDPAVIESVDGAVTVVWSEWRANQRGLRAQQLGLPTLEPRWSLGGVLIREGEVCRAPPSLAAIDDTTLAIAVQARSTPLETDVFVHALGASGTPPASWPPGGLAACVARGDQYRPAISPDGVGGLLVSWLDARPAPGTSVARLQFAGRPSVELVSAVATPGRARITWRAKTRIEGTVAAERRFGEDDWELLLALAPDDSAKLVLDDRSAPDGAHAEYRLAFPSGRLQLHSEVVTLDIPSAPRVLTLYRVRSLGREQALLVSFALPRGDTPRLDLLDIQGRRIFEQRIDGLEPGEHEVRWRLPGRVASGVYFLRLLQGREERSLKVPFIR